MAQSDPSSTPTEPQAAMYERVKQQFSTIPSVRGCAPAELYNVDGFYLAGISLIGTMATKHLFTARPTDIILATTPKSGTTWLKALTYALIARTRGVRHADPDHPLRKLNPHDCVPTLEFQLYTDEHRIPDLDPLPDPRIFNTHIPYGHLLPPSVIDKGCRIVYLCRNPKDTFVSMWHFSKDSEPPLSLDEAFECFCNGVSFFGPFWDHALGYWNASRERPEKVMFVKYEELMEDPVSGVRRLAEFLGCPFTEEDGEEEVEGIVGLCGFESLKNLEVNKSGKILGIVDNKRYFRRGKVGDWVNHLTPEMARQLDEISDKKFAGSGLTL